MSRLQFIQHERKNPYAVKLSGLKHVLKHYALNPLLVKNAVIDGNIFENLDIYFCPFFDFVRIESRSVFKAMQTNIIF